MTTRITLTVINLILATVIIVAISGHHEILHTTVCIQSVGFRC